MDSRHVHLLTILIFTQTAVTRLITVHEGTKAKIPCNVEIAPGDEVLAVYWHKSSGTVEGDILLANRVHGKMGGPGYEKGENDIAEDNSLIISKVTRNDRGTYECAVLVEPRAYRISLTIVDIHIEPPPPQLDKCPFNYLGMNRSQNCSYIVDGTGHDQINITCYVMGDFSNFNLYFQNQSGVISGISGQSQVNGVNISYVTISALPRSDPYECVAKVPESSNGERSSAILVQRQLVEVKSNDTSVEVKSSSLAIMWTLAFFCPLLLITCVILLVYFIHRARKKEWGLELCECVTWKREPPIEGAPLLNNCNDDIAMEINKSITNFDGTTRIWKCDPRNPKSDSRKEVIRTGSKIESLHCYNEKSMLSTMQTGALRFVKSLRLVNVNLDDISYPNMKQDADHWKIETLIIDNRDLDLDENSSNSLAHFIKILPELRNLHLVWGGLQKPILLSEAAKKEQMKQLWYTVQDLEAGEGHEMDDFMNALAQMRGLQTLGISVKNVTEECLSACLKELTSLQKLRISGEPISNSEDASCNLLDEIAKLPSLQALYLLRPGKRLLNIPSNLKITTLILREVTLSGAAMQAVFSVGTLRSVRFITVHAETADDATLATCTQLHQSPSMKNKVAEIRTDVESLPKLLHIGLSSYCTNARTLQADFTRDITTENIKSLQELTSAKTLMILKAFRKPSFFFCDSVALKDETVLRDVMELLTHVQQLFIIDITVGNEKAKKIVDAAPSRLEMLVMTRCNTTDDGIHQEPTRGPTRYSITHGKPDTKENGKGRRYKDYLQDIDQTHFNAHFDVIVTD